MKMKFSNRPLKGMGVLGVPVVLTVMLILFSLNVFAIPNTITLQGKLTNPSGTPQVGRVNFTFAIYDDYTGGNKLYELANKNITTDSNGIYDTILPNVNVNFSGQYYLGVTVGTDSESSPRINLSSSPSAFRANVSEDLNPANTYKVAVLNATSSLYAAQTLFVSSNLVGIGTIVPTEKLVVIGNVNISGTLNVSGIVTLANLASCTSIQSSSAGVLSCGNGDGTSPWSSSGANVYLNDSSAKVGIGTSAPSHSLTVVGNTSLRGNLSVSGNVSIDGTTFFVDSGSDRVGIGTVAPTAQLNAHSASGASQIMVSTDVNVGSANDASFFFESDRDGTPNNAGIGQFADGSLRFTGASSLVTPDMVIDDNGLVGIATKSPSNQLHVIGSVRFAVNDTNNISTTNVLTLDHFIRNPLNSTGGIGVGVLFRAMDNGSNTDDVALINATLTNSLNGSEGSSVGIYTRVNGEKLSPSLIVDRGKVGVNDTTPSYALDVTGNLRVVSGSGTEGLFVDSSGKVGIGTNTPDALLDVLSGTENSGGEDVIGTATITGPTIALTSTNKGTLTLISNTDLGTDVGPALTFAGRTDGGTGSAALASIFGAKENSVSSNTAGYLAFFTKVHNDLYTTEKMRITSTGNVGIGTSNPQEKLVVIGNANVSGSLNISGIVTLANLSSCSSIQSSSTGVLSCGSAAADGSGPWNSTGTNAYLNDSSTRVGIGTSNPQEKLVVIGNANISGTLNVSGLITAGDVTCSDCLAAGDLGADSAGASELASGAVTAAGTELDSTVAGDGIGLSSGALVVNTGTGLTTSSDNVVVDFSAVQSESSAFKKANLSGLQVNSTGWNRTGTNVILANQDDNVGIGTLTPSDKLHIVGGARIVVNDTNNVSTTNVLTLDHFIQNPLNSTGGIGTGILFRAMDNGSNTDDVALINATLTNSLNGSEGSSVGIYTRVNGGKLSPYLVVDRDKVGINTTSPANTLTVQGTLNVTPAGQGGSPAIFVKAGSSAASYVGIGNSNPTVSLDVLGSINANNSYLLGGATIMAFDNTDNKNLKIGDFNDNGQGVQLWAANTQVLTINESTANVGIGVSSPREKFVVIGNVNISGTLNVSGRITLANLVSCTSIQTNATGELSCGTSGDGTGPWNSSGTNVYLNDSTAKVGIGTVTPLSTLHVNGSGANGGFRVTNESGLTAFFVNSSSGFIGIGKSNPTAVIDINSTSTPTFLRYVGGSGQGAALQLGIATQTAGGGPSLIFFDYDSTGAKEFLGRVSGIWENPTAGSEAAALVFTARATSDTYALTEKMRLTSTGSLGIGTNAPTKALSINGTLNAVVIDPSATPNPVINTTGNNLTLTSASGSVIIRLG